jgi:hypothetical protein
MAVGLNVGGRWELLSVGHSAQLYHRSQMSPGGNWTDEAAFPGDSAYSIAVGQNADGRLELFYTNPNGFHHRWQTSPGGGPSQNDWAEETEFPGFSGVLTSAPVVVRNADGRLEVFYVVQD